MTLLFLKTTEISWFHNRERAINYCRLPNSRSRWIVHLRHMNVTVKIYILSMWTQLSSGVICLGFDLTLIYPFSWTSMQKWINHYRQYKTERFVTSNWNIVVGTAKNCLIEKVRLSTQNTCLNWLVRLTLGPTFLFSYSFFLRAYDVIAAHIPNKGT